MPNWETRLEVSVNGAVVTAIDSFNPTFNTPITQLHSIEADNIGHVQQPQTATFTMTLSAITTAVADLTQMALTGTRFDIQVAEKRGTDWAFSKLLFRECLLTSAGPSNVVIDGVPKATFNGVILGFRGESDIELKE